MAYIVMAYIVMACIVMARANVYGSQSTVRLTATFPKALTVTLADVLESGNAKKKPRRSSLTRLRKVRSLAYSQSCVRICIYQRGVRVCMPRSVISCTTVQGR